MRPGFADAELQGDLRQGPPLRPQPDHFSLRFGEGIDCPFDLCVVNQFGQLCFAVNVAKAIFSPGYIFDLKPRFSARLTLHKRKAPRLGRGADLVLALSKSIARNCTDRSVFEAIILL